MGLTNLLEAGKEKFYDLIYKGACAFPYSSDMMHVGIIGAAPFLVGKCTSELIGTKIDFFREHSTAIGLGASALAELAWSTLIETNSPYDHPGDIAGKTKGIAETGIGAGLVYLLTKLF